MSRLQKKCFVGATTMHGLLLLALLVGPAFFKPKPPEDLPILEFMPAMAVDEKFSGGGAPRPASNPEPVVQQPMVQPPQPQPQPTPPPPEPVRREEVRRPEPEPVRETPKTNLRDKDAPTEKKDTTKKHVVQVSNERVKLSQNRTTTKPGSSASTTNPNRELVSAIRNTGTRVSSGLSSTTRVDLPEGPGGGGVSYANYGQIVRKVYTDAWRVPDDMSDDEASIKVSVTIARDGKVLSSRITQSSGSSAADRSIQNTLDRITHIGVAFPAGAKESERTFVLTFNLKAKKAFG